MYCLRSFVVLLLLPLPLAPPLWSFLFFVAFYLTRRPCIYCTVLLIGLFISTCHWDLNPSSILSSERISSCWCDGNGGHLLSYRSLGTLNDTSTNITHALATNNFSSSVIDVLRIHESATSSLARAINSFSSSVDAFSTAFIEPSFGFKLAL